MTSTARIRLVKGLASAIYGRGVLILGQVLTVPVLITRWGAGGYGEWLALTALTTYLAYTNVGVPGTVRSDMAMADGRGDRTAVIESFQTCLALVAGVGLIAGLAFAVAIRFLPMGHILNASFMGPQQVAFVLTILAIQIIVYSTGNVVQAALSALGRYGLATFIDATRQLGEFAGLLVMVGLFKARPEQAVLVYLITSGLYFIGQIACLYRTAPDLFNGLHLRRSVFGRLWRPMLGVLSMSLGYYGMTVQAPRIILASVVGPSAVALYSVTTMLMRMVRIPIDIPAHAATVELSMAVGKGDFEGARKLLQGTTRFSMWLALAAIPVVLALGPTATTLWTAGRITPSYDLLSICCASTALFSLALPSQEALMSVNKLDRATFWIIAMAAPYLGVSWLLAKTFGLDGVALGVLMMDLAYAGISLFWVTRFFDMPASTLMKALAKPPIDLVQKEINMLLVRLLPPAKRQG